MRSALLVVFSMLMAAMPATSGEARGSEIRLLVPADAPIGTLSLHTDSTPHLPWKRILVPVTDSVGETLATVKRELGTEVLVEQRYPLLGATDEPGFDDQWGLENTGQSGGKVDADIDAARAWSVSTGKGVVVAVVDSGIDMTHPDLDDQIWVNADEAVNGKDDDSNDFIDDVVGWDFVGRDNDPGPTGTSDDDAHATFIAGVIAAEINGEGIVGVAPDARLMNLRACDNGGCFSYDAARAVLYAVDNGADIINMSFGGFVPEEFGDPALESAIDYARQHDVLVVAAAGNTPPDEAPPGEIIVPAELPNPNNLAVAATGRADRVADFSYYGPNIDIAAPGVDIVSTRIGGYAFWDGTSFAAPFVSGAAALLLAANPGAGYEEVAGRLLGWVDRPAGVSGKVASGRLNAASPLIHRFLDTVGTTFEADIEWAAAEGVTRGCNPPENTLFCPADAVTRGQMAAFLRRHLGLPAPTRDYFDDDNGTTFEADINRLAEAGITRGCNPPANDRFCPDDLVTREQMAAFLVRALNLTKDTHPGFDDVPPSNIFIRDIEKLATAGITKGCNPPANSLFCPKANVTRGQMTAFLHRADS